MSWLDLAIALYLALHLVTGYQQGLFLSGGGLLALGVAAAIALATAHGLAHLLGGPPVLHALVLGGLVFAVLKVLQGRAVQRWGPRLAERPRWQALDRWLGLLPGLAWGALGAGLVAWFCAAFGGGLPAGSPLAGFLLARLQDPLQTLGESIPRQ